MQPFAARSNPGLFINPPSFFSRLADPLNLAVRLIPPISSPLGELPVFKLPRLLCKEQYTVETPARETIRRGLGPIDPR